MALDKIDRKLVPWIIGAITGLALAFYSPNIFPNKEKNDRNYLVNPSSNIYYMPIRDKYNSTNKNDRGEEG